jgi:hypothetical protein
MTKDTTIFMPVTLGELQLILHNLGAARVDNFRGGPDVFGYEAYGPGDIPQGAVWPRPIMNTANLKLAKKLVEWNDTLLKGKP